MANEIVPDNMSKALNQIDRLRGLIVYRCTRGDIRLINEPLRKDIADLRAAVDALDQAFQKECERSNRTGATGAHKLKMRTKLLLFAALGPKNENRSMGRDHPVDYPSLAAWISRRLAILVSLRDDFASVDIRLITRKHWRSRDAR
jgi:hypothetical protein